VHPAYLVLIGVVAAACAWNLFRARTWLDQAAYALVLVPLVLRLMGLK
jgi:ABC-type molybdate transport system permease subunit